MTFHRQPLVSVIIPFLNEAQFLAEAIESVLQQDYPDWELLLVDDGSTNESTGIAKHYAARYPGKVIYIEHEGHRNKGVCASRNEGIRQARGELIAFLDADDVWLPKKLSDQVAVFQRFPQVAMVAEASLYWNSWSAPAEADVLIPVGAPQDRPYLPGELSCLLYPLSDGAAPCPSGLMITKAALNRIGGFEESFTGEYQLYEDQAFLQKAYLKEIVYVSSAANNKYRQRMGSCVQQVHADGRYHTVRRYFLEWLKAYLISEVIDNGRVRQLVRRAQLPYTQPGRHFFTAVIPARLKRMVRRGLHMLIK